MPPDPAAEEIPWHRVDPKTILVKPFNEILGFIPVLVGLVFLGQQDNQRFWWGLAGIGLLVLRGLVHWATTRYRITGQQVEVRTGLVNRQRFATKLDRVRTVESTAKFGHRLFGVTSLRIGTGQHEEKKHKGLVLDAITRREAERLRQTLLHRKARVTTSGESTVDSVEEPIAALDRSWLRYAPLTMSGLISIGVLAGLIWRMAGELNVDITSFPPARAVLNWAENTTAGVVIAVGVLTLIVIGLLGSFVVYVFQFTGYRLTREADGTLHVRRGLLTTSSVTLEEARLRGVEVREPLLLRAAGGARVSAVATGLRNKSAESHVLMPPGPATEANRVAGDVLRTRRSPTTAPLVPHPRPALRRRLTRALVPTAVLIVALWLVTLPGWLPNWPWQAACVLLPIAVGLAYDRYRGLGHAIAGAYLVTRFGSLDRKTVALQRSGIIGWKLRRSFFQRRVGLITVAATTAAGRGAYHVLDLAESEGLALVEATTPGLLAPFIEPMPAPVAEGPAPVRSALGASLPASPGTSG